MEGTSNRGKNHRKIAIGLVLRFCFAPPGNLGNPVLECSGNPEDLDLLLQVCLIIVGAKSTGPPGTGLDPHTLYSLALNFYLSLASGCSCNHIPLRDREL